MFTLSELLKAATLAPVVPQLVDGPNLRVLSGKEYRFPVPGVPAVRLPRDVSGLEALLASAGPHEAVCWAALTSPVHRVPLQASDGCRRVALLTACEDGNGGHVLAIVTLTMRSRGRFGPAEIAAHRVDLATDQEQMLDQLERLWEEAEPAARAAASGAPAVWLGGNPAAILPGGNERVRGVAATFGLRIEVVSEPSRHVPEIATRLGSSPPSYLIVWRPGARNVDPAVAAFRKATAEGELVELCESEFADALLELRWGLAELGLADTTPRADGDQQRTAPTAGEERFYVKFRGSKVGDVMIDVPDCGHQQWGGDERSRAPRALKGIGRLEAITPKGLHLCARCSRNRWRARF